MSAASVLTTYMPDRALGTLSGTKTEETNDRMLIKSVRDVMAEKLSDLDSEPTRAYSEQSAQAVTFDSIL